MRNTLRFITRLIPLLLLKAAVAQTGYNVTLFSGPGSELTVACGIDSGGDVVGWYTLESGARDIAFERAADGTFSDVGPPINYKHQAFAGGINDSGAIAGSVLSVGFVSDDGMYTYFGDTKHVANANGINNSGTSVGAVTVEASMKAGYISSARERPYIFFLGEQAAFFAINNSETAVGAANGQGFIWTKSGTQMLDAPGATTTGAFGINDSGVVVGGTNLGSQTVICGGVSATSQGFLYSNGAFTAFNVSGAVGTVLYGINNSGQLVGTIYVGPGEAMAFIATPQ